MSHWPPPPNAVWWYPTPIGDDRVEVTTFGQQSHPMDALVSAMKRLCVEVGALERELEAAR